MSNDEPSTEQANELVHLTSEMVRVLAHPLRARLLALLRVEGAATASALAARVGTNSGATSYHLRQLAEAGLVVEDTERGTKRDRWWKSAHHGHSWRDAEHDDDPDARVAADWLTRNAHRNYARHVDAWHDVRTEWPLEWRNAADQSDFAVRATAAQLTELNERVHELIREYEYAADLDDPDAEHVMFVLYSFPFQAANL